MAPIKRFNETRAQRATSERRFELGPYTLVRRVSVKPESIMGFQARVAAADGDDAIALAALEDAITGLCEPDATLTRNGQALPFLDAWRDMREQGDEYGPLDVRDLSDLMEWLVGGVAERPTGAPSDSPGGSTTPPTGTTSTDDSPSPGPTLTLSTPDGASTLSTPA